MPNKEPRKSELNPFSTSVDTPISNSSNTIPQPPVSFLPHVPPDIFILVEGEPNQYFQSIVAWRGYAHLSFEEMRFAVHEIRRLQTQTACANCSTTGKGINIANGSSLNARKSEESWVTKLERLANEGKETKSDRINLPIPFGLPQQRYQLEEDMRKVPTLSERIENTGDQATDRASFLTRFGFDATKQDLKMEEVEVNANEGAEDGESDHGDLSEDEEKLVKCILVEDGETNEA